MPDTRHTPTLVEWLTARLDEDEARALAAIEDDGGQDGGFEDAFAELTRPPSGVGYAQGGFGEAAARMIVHHTPRRVLADVAAKRRIVRLHDNRCQDCGAGRRCIPHDVSVGPPSVRYLDPVDWFTLRALVSVYRDAPGYRTEWEI